jgi:hypothetical protein
VEIYLRASRRAGGFASYPAGITRAGPKQIQLSGKLAQRRLRSYRAEFTPYFGSIKPIVETIELLLENSDKLTQISGELIHLAEPLVRKKACRQVAKIVAKMLP